MSNRNYYTLIASLPYLPRFDKAERLPITRERLLQRLTMLDANDAKLAEIIADFISWRRQPKGRTNSEIVSLYNKNVSQIFESPQLKSILEYPVSQRTILTALRRKHQGLPVPKANEPWGAGPLVKQIERNWEHPYFKLNYQLPWMPQAQAYINEGSSLKLEHYLMNISWEKLNSINYSNPFGFENVIAYLLKWDLLRQWLAYNKENAKIRFEELVSETIHDYEKRTKE